MIIIASHGLPSVAVVIGRLCDTMAIILSRCGRLLEFFGSYVAIIISFFRFSSTECVGRCLDTVVNHYQATTSNIFLKYKN